MDERYIHVYIKVHLWFRPEVDFHTDLRTGRVEGMDIRENRLYLGGLAASALVEEFGSPLYVYEEKTLHTRARELLEAITYPKREIKYACKANTNLEIMKIFREEGMSIDAVSPGEVYSALKAGFDPGQILFTTNNATHEEIEYGMQRGVKINVDSLSQLRFMGERYPGSKVCVRINPNVGAGHHDHVITGGPESKFGIDYTQVDRIKDLSRACEMTIVGIHQHIGSGILQPEKFIQAMDVLLETAEKFDDLTFIDFGGGIGVPYREEDRRINMKVLGQKISEEFDRFCRSYGRELTLIIEPGRYLVAESGFLLATVTSIKEGQNHRFVGVNSGFNHLVRPAMYGSYHPILNADVVDGNRIPQTIAGNLCESGDTFTRNEEGIVDRDLPPFSEGDLVAILNAGAYGYSMASLYNTRPRPAEVLVEGGRARLIRKRETIEDLVKE
jgi:diaminopimelate decarboxylase